MIVVTGATGQVGSAVVGELTNRGVPVRAVVQPGQALPGPQRNSVQTVYADFGDARALAAAAEGASAWFLMSPPDQRQPAWQRAQLRAAVDAGVARIVKLSAFDSSPDTPSTLGRWHWEGEQEVRGSGVAYAILRPQYFVENLLQDVAGLRAGRMTTFIPDGRAVGTVASADVGAVAAALLCTPDFAAYDRRILVPTGPAAVTTKDVADAVGRQLHRPVEPVLLEGESAIRALRANGRPDWHVRDVLHMCGTASDLVTSDIQEVTGRAARDVAAVVASRFATDVGAAVEGQP